MLGMLLSPQPQDNTMKKKWINPKEETLVENKGFYDFLPRLFVLWDLR